MAHVFLVGFMGAGKSTVASLVAEQLGLPCVDLDSRIEAEAGRSVARVFEEDGEEVFRDLETQALLELADAPDSIVACGGGIVLRDANRAALKRLGRVVFLRVSVGETLARIGDDGTRPLLAGHAGTLAATRLLKARESLYAAVADLVVDTVGRTPSEIAAEVAIWVIGEAA